MKLTMTELEDFITGMGGIRKPDSLPMMRAALNLVHFLIKLPDGREVHIEAYEERPEWVRPAYNHFADTLRDKFSVNIRTRDEKGQLTIKHPTYGFVDTNRENVEKYLTTFPV